MEEESGLLDTNYSVSQQDGDSVQEDSAYSATSSPSGLKLRLIKNRAAALRSASSASSNGTNNGPKSGTTTPVSAVKSRPKQGTKNRSSTGSSSSSPTSNNVNSSSSKKQQNNQPLTSDGKKIIHIPPCDDVTTNREILTRLPAKEACDLYVGDIIWSKVSGYPWWPCMITLDPYTGKYSRFGVSAEKPLYHVQYFGSKALRSYTSPGLTMPFEGREKYELEVDRIKNTPGTQKALRKQALNRLVIKPSFKKEWKFACDEAEEALKLDRENRIKDLTFVYIMVKDDGRTSKTEGSDSTKTPKSVKKNKKPENPLNVYDFSDNDEDFDDEGTSPTLCLWSAKRANRKGDFDVYVSQTRSKLMEENPDASGSEIDHMLKTRWSHMSDDLQAKYCVREVNGKDTKTPNSKIKKTPVKKPETEKSPRGRKRKNEVKKENQTNGDVPMAEGNGDVSENENALVIADTTTPKKSRKSKGESEGSGKRSAKTPKTVVETIKTPKEVKLPKATPKSKSTRTTTPKEETESSAIKSERINTKSTPSKSKAKEEVKESSPRKRPSSTPVDKSAATSEKPKRPRKSTIKENGQSLEEKVKTPKSQEKGKGKETKDKTKDKEMNNHMETDQDKNKENDKEKEKNVSIKRKSVQQQLETVESEETRTSEDASSQSEMEAAELNDRVCDKCSEEALEDYIQCSGPCLRYYHNNCLPKTFNSETLQCHECTTGAHLCFICHSHSSDVKKCSDSTCGKFYHIKCLQNSYPHKMIKDEDSEGFICPLHSCLTCYVEHQDDQVHSYMKKRLLKCLKCPTAYHFTDACLSAGSVTISFSYIICPEHIPSRKSVNVNWCFSCNTGGSLICCERCPSSFHQACLETPLPEGGFFCGDCVVRKQLHYNDIVWVKLGSYRWWPGKVCHPKNVPDNVMNLSHHIGEFPVYFFGSHDYFWIHRGKAFPFVEGDLTKAPALAKGAKRDFRDAISEAIEAFTSWQEARRTSWSRKIKPPPYVYLRVNKRVGKAPKVSPREDDDTEPIVCQCKSDGDHPCGVDEDCFNRLTLIECDPSRCNAGDKCQNRRFRKREYAKVQPFKTESRGWGLKALQDIKKGTFVIEYVGELIDEAECENRIKNMIEKHEPNFYFLTIDRDTIIDAGPKGNLARFMNHSCSPNCETQKWVVGGITRVGLFAIQDIPQDAELTFNYNLHCRGNEKTACNCGAKNCSGFLGVRPNKIPDEESSRKQSKLDKAKAKAKPKNQPKKEFESFHEDECFKCGEGGQLVMCDKRKCPKSYHLLCVKAEKLPRGLWFCPYHHCDECGKQSTKFCGMCPTSFCNDHGTNLLNENDKGLQICYEHVSSDETSSSELAKPIESTTKKVDEIKENGDSTHEDAIDSLPVTEPEKIIEKSEKDDALEEEESEDQPADETEKMEVDTTEAEEISQIPEQVKDEVNMEEAEKEEKKTENKEPEPMEEVKETEIQVNEEPKNSVDSVIEEKKEGLIEEEKNETKEVQPEEEEKPIDKDEEKVETEPPVEQKTADTVITESEVQKEDEKDEENATIEEKKEISEAEEKNDKDDKDDKDSQSKVESTPELKEEKSSEETPTVEVPENEKNEKIAKEDQQSTQEPETG